MNPLRPLFKAARHLLHLFRRQTAPIQPLSVLATPAQVPLPFPWQQTISKEGRTTSFFSRDPATPFPEHIYTDAFRGGAAGMAEWGHVVEADAGLAREVFGAYLPPVPKPAHRSTVLLQTESESSPWGGTGLSGSVAACCQVGDIEMGAKAIGKLLDRDSPKSWCGGSPTYLSMLHPGSKARS